MTTLANPITIALDHFYTTFCGNTDQFNISLMNGLGGAALVSAHLANSSLGGAAGADFGRMSNDLIKSLLTRLESGDLGITSLHSLSSGLAGVIYALDQLHAEGFSEHQLDRGTRNDLADILHQQSTIDFKERNTDFLHGPLGVIFVLLRDAKHPHTATILNELFEQYVQQLKRDERGVRIYNSVLEGQLEQDEYNFGLAHGMAGHAMLWTDAYAKGFRQQETKALVTDLLSYLDSYRIAPATAPEKPHAHYPKSVIENNDEAWNEARKETYRSRVGWCYGDLNIAFAKIKAGRVFGREDWLADGLDLARQSALRLDPVEAQVNENLFFCHGTAGLIYMFGQLREVTGEAIFAEAADHWRAHMEVLLVKPKYADLKLRRPASLLDGVTGLALGTLAADAGRRLPMADALLLTL